MVVCNTKRTGSIVAFLAISHSLILCIYHRTCLFSDNQGIDIPLLKAGVVMSTAAQYRLHVYLVVNPKGKLELKMAVTEGF